MTVTPNDQRCADGRRRRPVRTSARLGPSLRAKSGSPDGEQGAATGQQRSRDSFLYDQETRRNNTCPGGRQFLWKWEPRKQVEQGRCTEGADHSAKNRGPCANTPPKGNAQHSGGQEYAHSVERSERDDRDRTP